MFTRARNWVTDKANAINPQAALFDQEDDNFATGLNNCVTKDGQNKPSATMDWNNQRLTNLAAATARVDALQTAQFQDGGPLALGSVSGTDTITGSLTPAITAYANLMRVNFIPAATNTGAATLNINSVAARSIVDVRGTALVAGALVSGVPASVVYDLANTRWVLQTGAKVADAQLGSNVALLNASNTFTGATQTISASSAKMALTATSTTTPTFDFTNNSTVRGRIFAPGTNDHTITGSLVGDWGVYVTGGRFIIGGGSGTNVPFALTADTGVIVTPDMSASEVGFKGAPGRNVSASTNTAQTDAGRTIHFTGGSGQTFTLDSDPPTDSVVILDNASGNSWTIAAGGTLTWAATGGTGSRTLANGGMAVALHLGSGNWKINGGGVA